MRQVRADEAFYGTVDVFVSKTLQSSIGSQRSSTAWSIAAVVGLQYEIEV